MHFFPACLPLVFSNTVYLGIKPPILRNIQYLHKTTRNTLRNIRNWDYNRSILWQNCVLAEHNQMSLFLSKTFWILKSRTPRKYIKQWEKRSRSKFLFFRYNWRSIGVYKFIEKAIFNVTSLIQVWNKLRDTRKNWHFNNFCQYFPIHASTGSQAQQKKY